MTAQERFTQIQTPNVPRSQYDRSFGYKSTVDVGKLYPIYLEHAIPGDTFNVQPTIFGRSETLLKPIMDNIYADIHFFSVPYRLVFDNFTKMMGEQTDPGDSIDYLIPQMEAPENGYDTQTLADYFGLPTKVENYSHSSLPFRAYNLIWNQWYRDEDIQDSLPVPRGDGPDTIADFALQYRNKRKDYFTSARPWAQKADPVTIPLQSNHA